MKITFCIDQTLALKMGINAPSDTVVLDLDPTEFTQSERDLLEQTLQALSGELRATNCVHTHGRNLGFLRLLEPSLAGLRVALTALEAKVTENEQEVQREREAHDERIRQSLGAYVSHTEVLYMQGDGQVSQYCGDVRAELTLKMPTHIPATAYDAALADTVTQHNQHVIALKTAARESLLPELRTKLDAHKAEKEATAVEYAALYAQLPAPFRARDAGGFATDEELTLHLQALLRTQAGFRDHQKASSLRECGELTDAEFALYQRVVPLLPEGSTHIVVHLYDIETDEDCEDCRGGGEGEVNQRIAICVEWTRGGVDVEAQLLIRAPDNHAYAMPAEEFIAARIG